MDFQVETVHQASIASVQQWLASELELHKIDAVIYTRHVLNIFLNSRHTNDLHLAEKEANIFAKLPGSKNSKPKKKYNKRNNSFNIADEILLKKEMAVKCLLSAVDRNNDDVVNDASIKNLIENLCSKLNDLNMLTESKSSSSSDEEHTTKKHRSLSLPNKQREKYQDAFPLLYAASSGENAQANVNSVWGTKPLFTKESSNHETTEKKPCDGTAKLQPAAKPRLSRNRQRSKLETPSRHVQSSSRISSKFSSKSSWQRKQNSTKVTECKDPNKYTENRQKQDRKLKSNPVVKKSISKPRKDPVSENEAESTSARVVSRDGLKRQPLRRHVSAPVTTQYEPNQPFQTGYHVFGVTTPECWQFTQLESTKKPSEEQPKLQSKWFRDPQSGFLEFDPGKKSPSSTSVQLEEVFGDEDRGSASESWLWCPSPSLWEDKESTSPGFVASRLETMYRPSTSDSPEAGQLWEDYKAIFSEVENDLQKFAEESCDDSDDSDHLPQQLESILNSIWAEESYFPHGSDKCSKDGDENGNYLEQEMMFCEKESCPEPACLSCSVLKSSLVEEGVDLEALDTSISKDLALLHQKMDAISEEINSLSKKTDVGSSRKRIWLRNSQDSDYDWPAKYFCGMEENHVFSGMKRWSDWDCSLLNGEFSKKRPMAGNFFADVTSTVFESANLQWLNWSYIDPMMDIDRLLRFQTSSEFDADAATDEDEDEDGCFVTTLVQSVVEFGTDADEQNPLMLQVDRTDPDDPTMDEDQPLPHPEDQLPTSFPPNPHNFQKKSKGLADCVTENEAWKTSLRIGNMWQAIAGIRPVDIIYSEKQTPTDPCVLQPSAMTHFRPIHQIDENENNMCGNATSLEMSHTFYQDGPSAPDISPKKPLSTSLYSDSVEFQLKNIEKEIGKLLFENPCNKDLSKTCHKKLCFDKCQQTGTFEHRIQLMDNDLENEFEGRPPKANSR